MYQSVLSECLVYNCQVGTVRRDILSTLWAQRKTDKRLGEYITLLVYLGKTETYYKQLTEAT